MNHDLDLGYAVQPVRYSTGDRETIDLIRDSMTDEQFLAFCWGQVLRYRDRAKAPEADADKAAFYEEMAVHLEDVLAGEPTPRPDPRHGRQRWQPYQRRPFVPGTHGVTPKAHAERGWYDAQLRGTAQAQRPVEGRLLLLVEVPEQVAARLAEGRAARVRLRPQETR